MDSCAGASWAGRDTRWTACPTFHFAEAGCTYCGECVMACPVDLDGQASTARPTIGIATIDSARCLAWRGIICMSCRFTCPDHAIGADRRGRPEIETSACTGCGQCISPCPEQAITPPDPAA